MSDSPIHPISYSENDELISGEQRDDENNASDDNESHRNDDNEADDAVSNNSSLPDDPLKGRPIRIRRPPEGEDQEDMEGHDDAQDQEDAEGQDDTDDVDDVGDVGDGDDEYDEDDVSDPSPPSSPDPVYGLPQNTPPPISDERAIYGGAAVNPTCHQGHIWCHGAMGGGEITKSRNIDPEILMCMACEGLQFEATPSANVPFFFGTYNTSRYHEIHKGRNGVFNRPTALFRLRDNAIAR